MYEFQINHEKFGDVIIFDEVSKKNQKCKFFVKNNIDNFRTKRNFKFSRF